MLATTEISFILATHNRREVTLDTLAALFGASKPTAGFEVLVVDNASSDGTVEEIKTRFPAVEILARAQNLGSCAKALAVEQAKGQFIVFLDDDSHPQPGSVERMIQHFENDCTLGAAGFRVHLPDGREECSALPNVFIGCGVGFRADALRAVGGLDASLFMQAEEYDLSFRLINAGWQVQTFGDLHVNHLKTTQARRSGRTTYYDIRNNLLVAARYLPKPYLHLYREDWLQRYAWLAARDGRGGSFLRGVFVGLAKIRGERRRYTSHQLSPQAFESLFRWQFIADRMANLAKRGVGRIVLADLGKNVLAFQRAADRHSLQILAIGDDRFSASGRHYRGVPVLTLAEALDLKPDAVVVANTSPVHSAAMLCRLTTLDAPHPVAWFATEHHAALDEDPVFPSNHGQLTLSQLPGAPQCATGRV